MAIMEYDTALKLLRKLLAESDEGSGRLALVEGGLASGKTRLLHEFFRHAVESGALLLSATGSRAEHTLRMGVVDQLFRTAESVAAVPDKLFNSLDDMKWEDEGALSRTHQHAEADDVRELSGALLELSKHRPLAIVVDDVHFADSGSLRVLLSLQRRMRTARVLLVLNEWARPQPTMPLFRAELTRHPHHRIRLAPLSIERITELIADPLGVETAATLVY